MFTRFFVSCLFVVLAQASAFAIDKNIQITLRSELLGKTLYLRGFTPAPTEFPPEVAIHMDVAFEARKISFNANSMKLEGKQTRLAFDRETGTITKHNEKNAETMKIEIFLDSGGNDIDSIRSTLNKVIATNLADAKNLLPEDCSGGLIQTNNDEWKCQEEPQTSDSLKLKDITPPRMLNVYMPQYTEWARKTLISGKVILLINIDEKGVPAVLAVLHPLGAVLTEEVIRVARKWKWSPALDSNGKPVEMTVAIEFNFDRS